MDPENLIRVCEKLVLRLGVAGFFQSLSDELITRTITHCHVGSKDELITLVHRTGIILFLKEKINTDVLRDYCREWKSFDNPLSHAEMVEYLSDEIMFSGMENWLEQFPRQLLEDWCVHLQIECKSSEPESIIIDKILSKIFINKLEPLNLMVKPSSELTNEEINQSDEDSLKRSTSKTSKRKHSTDNHNYHPKKKLYHTDNLHNNQSNDETYEESDEAEKYRSKKDSEDSYYSENDSPRKKRSVSTLSVLSAINKTTTKEELDAYFLKDLQNFCREHNISYVGRKSEIINRIISYLETGEKPKRRYTRRKYQDRGKKF